MPKRINIAIDGYSSCGKSTLARDLAHELGYIYIDSGAMYRAVTFYCLEHTIDPGNNKAVIESLIKINIQFKQSKNGNRTMLNGEDVEEKIREMRISNKVSEVSTIPEVRQKMVKMQRSYGRDGGVVMDGRDIGTVVFPDAELKIFMEANQAIRAKRRSLELERKGKPTSEEEVLKNLSHRDFLDSTRKVSPLKKAEDAIVLNNSELSKDQQMSWALNLVKVRLSN